MQLQAKINNEELLLLLLLLPFLLLRTRRKQSVGQVTGKESAVYTCEYIIYLCASPSGRRDNQRVPHV